MSDTRVNLQLHSFDRKARLVHLASERGVSPSQFLRDVIDALSGGRLVWSKPYRQDLGVASSGDRVPTGQPASLTPIQDNIDANGGKYVGPEKMRVPSLTEAARRWGKLRP